MTDVLGFTGTRHGLTAAQLATLPMMVPILPDRFLHGGAPGADAQVDGWIAAHPAMSLDRIDVYPCNEEREEFWRSIARQRSISDPARQLFNVRPPLERNVLIVRRSTRMLAMPGEMTEVVRSGTWYMIRRARLFRCPLTIVFPDGSVRVEKPAPMTEPLSDLLGVDRCR